jgi:hypothetical protein
VAAERGSLSWFLKTAVIHACIAALAPLVAIAITMSAQSCFRDPMVATIKEVLVDVALAFRYSGRILAGEVPYRDFVIEYPPLSLPIFLAPRLLTSDYLQYIILYTVQMLAADLLAIWLIVRVLKQRGEDASIPERLSWYTMFVLGLSPIVFFKFDLAATVLALGAAVVWFGGKPISGGLLAGAGALLKVYPALIAGLAFISDLTGRTTRRWRGLVTTTVVVALGVLIWYQLAGQGLTSSIAYHAERGLEIEAVSAGLLMLAGKMTGAELAYNLDHGSFQLVLSGAGEAAALAPFGQAAILLLVLWRFRRFGLHEPMRYCAAAILGFVAAGKVLSPQYMIWLFPFVALAEGAVWRTARILFLACCMLTSAVYPWSFSELLRFAPLGIAILNLRNMLLIVLLGLLVFAPTAGDAHSEEAGYRREGV